MCRISCKTLAKTRRRRWSWSRKKRSLSPSVFHLWSWRWWRRCFQVNSFHPRTWWAASPPSDFNSWDWSRATDVSLGSTVHRRWGDSHLFPNCQSVANLRHGVPEMHFDLTDPRPVRKPDYWGGSVFKRPNKPVGRSWSGCLWPKRRWFRRRRAFWNVNVTVTTDDMGLGK